MNLKEITDQLRDATHDKLLVLADWCQSEATKRDPVKIAYEKKMAESMAKYQAEADREAAEERALIVKLKKFIKPGMKLKMKGCKDGTGIREFIKWEDDQLVCWQIIRGRRGIPGHIVTFENKTNQVTTHMANKVQKIFVDGTGLCVKSILN